MVCDIIIDKNAIIIKNATDENMNAIVIPKYIEKLTIIGQLTKYKVPEHIKYLDACNLGLESIELNDNLEYLHCCNNNITTLELPSRIQFANLEDNKLCDLTARHPLTHIRFLDITDNNFEKFDLLLPKTMFFFNIGGNPNIKIKYINFIFTCDISDSIIDGDYKYILGDGILAISGYARCQVAQRAYAGQKYIDVSKFI